jgi:hypothetical protein
VAVNSSQVNGVNFIRIKMPVGCLYRNRQAEKGKELEKSDNTVKEKLLEGFIIPDSQM